MSGPLDFYRAIANSATKNAPPPEPDYTGEIFIGILLVVFLLAVVGLFTVGRFLFGQ